MLQKHGAPLAREFCSDTEKFDGRPNRRKPLSELKSQIACWLVPPPATSLEKLARLPWLKKNQILSLDRYWAHLVRLLPAQGEPLVKSCHRIIHESLFFVMSLWV